MIRAPLSGVVTDRYAHPGELISPQTVGGFTQTGICTLVDNPLDIVVDAYFVALENDGTARVLDGLQDGEMIVASATGALEDGRRVREQ